MKERDQNPYKENEDRDDLDRALDAALAKYSAVEPRAGLEQRIMANLKAQPAVESAHARWHWALSAGAFAVLCIAAALWWNASRHPNSAAPDQAKQTHSAPERPKQVGVPAIQAGQVSAPARRRKRTQQENPVVAQRTPRLNKFPQPQPLTPEEVALARYVAQFPAEATLIAQAQEEYARESEQKMGISASDTQSSLEQEER